MRKVLNKEQKENLERIMRPKVEGIIKAELDTYKTVGSDQNGRIYIFSTFSIGIAELPDGITMNRKNIAQAIAQFQRQEPESLSEDMRSYYDNIGRSHVTGILIFSVVNSIYIPKEEMYKYPGLQEGLDSGELTPEQVIEEYKELHQKALSIQFTSLWADWMKTYKFIEHNGDVIDLLLQHEMDIEKELLRTPEDKIGGDMLTLSELLQVE